MRKKRRVRKSSKLSVLCISTIVSLGLLGVGYGYWTDGLNIDVNITTGNADVWGTVNKPSSLSIDISEDGKTIAFSGQMYRDDQEELEISIKDTGTVPMILEDVVKGENTDIADLSQQGKARYALFSTLIKDDTIETFNLCISPPQQEVETDYPVMQMATFSMNSYVDEEEDDWYQVEINRLVREIDSLQEEINSLHHENEVIGKEIDRLSIIEEHNFKYELHFIQGI